MNTKIALIAIFVSAVITFGLRALPFLVFQEGKELPDQIKRLGMVLPSEEFMKIYTPIEKFSHKDIKSIGETKPPQMCKRSRKSQKKAIFTHLIFLT